jgi:hypothetical protein
VRILIPDPFERWLIIAIARFWGREKEFPRELATFLSQFMQIYKRVPQYLQVRAYTHMPSLTATMFDGRRGSVELYMRGWKTSDRLVLELDLEGEARDVRARLEEDVWERATVLDSEPAFLKRLRAVEVIIRDLDAGAVV